MTFPNWAVTCLATAEWTGTFRGQGRFCPVSCQQEYTYTPQVRIKPRLTVFQGSKLCITPLVSLQSSCLALFRLGAWNQVFRKWISDFEYFERTKEGGGGAALWRYDQVELNFSASFTLHPSGAESSPGPQSFFRFFTFWKWQAFLSIAMLKRVTSKLVLVVLAIW